VDIRKRSDTSFNGSFKTIGRIGMRKTYGRLDCSQDILGAVFGLPSESGYSRVVPLSLSDVPGDF
jgi:hypothetical protein